jgi:hypothetical protein
MTSPAIRQLTGSRCFMVQEPLKRSPDGELIYRINMGKVKHYGKPINIFSWSEIKERDDPNPDMLVWRLRTELHDFSDRDYIVPVGNPCLIGMAIAIAAECNEGRVKVLDWSKVKDDYRLMEIDFRCQPQP